VPPVELIIAAKICDVFALTGTIAWLIYYTRTSRWWTNWLSINFAVKTLIIGAFSALTAVSLFLQMNRGDSIAVAWCQVILLGVIGPVMLQRIWLFRHRSGTRTCPKGHVTSAAYRFCPECGTRMPEAAR
jgi:hypothetical protein